MPNLCSSMVQYLSNIGLPMLGRYQFSHIPIGSNIGSFLEISHMGVGTLVPLGKLESTTNIVFLHLMFLLLKCTFLNQIIIMKFEKN